MRDMLRFLDELAEEFVVLVAVALRNVFERRHVLHENVQEECGELILILSTDQVECVREDTTDV